MQNEVWLPIKTHEGFYAASTLGNVRSLPRTVFVPARNIYRKLHGKLIAPNLDRKGYPYLILCKNSVTTSHKVHRLVAETHIPNPNNYPQVNHKNGIKTDNRVENLEWCDNSHNQKHALATGLRKARNENKKWRRVVINKPGKDMVEFENIATAARFIGCAPPHLRNVCLGKKKTAKGYAAAFV